MCIRVQMQGSVPLSSRGEFCRLAQWRQLLDSCLPGWARGWSPGRQGTSLSWLGEVKYEQVAAGARAQGLLGIGGLASMLAVNGVSLR